MEFIYRYIFIFRRTAETQVRADDPKCKLKIFSNHSFHNAGIFQQHLLRSNSTPVKICLNRIPSIVLGSSDHSCFIPLWYVPAAILHLRGSLRPIFLFHPSSDDHCSGKHTLCRGLDFNGLCLQAWNRWKSSSNRNSTDICSPDSL